jgi:glycosyltransferase involved in cell wall biosynthesis
VSAVHVVVPDGIDDPARPSGGNAYDRQVCNGLTAIGWSVHEHATPGGWPCPDDAARAALGGVLAALADGSVVLVDGLIASAVPDVLVPEAGRLRLVVLVHMPLGDQTLDECAVLSAAAAVVTTSPWTQRWLADRYGISISQLHVAEPGVAPADLAAGTPTGGELLCVAAVHPGKGHDVLLAALTAVRDLPWHCACVGSLDRDPDFVDRVARQARDSGIADRVVFTGPRTGAALDATYAAADLLVLASRGETYGMVVTEALARGLPVIATAVGGLPEALGSGTDGRPGLLVPPGDATALADALRCWLDDADLRHRLRGAARERRGTLTGWASTARQISGVLDAVAA